MSGESLTSMTETTTVLTYGHTDCLSAPGWLLVDTISRHNGPIHTSVLSCQISDRNHFIETEKLPISACSGRANLCRDLEFRSVELWHK